MVLSVSNRVISGVAAMLAAGAMVFAAPASAQWSDVAEACYQSEGEPSSAVILCTQAIEAGDLDDESLALTYSNRGNSYYDLGEYDRAVGDYNIALDLLPGDPVTLSNRGAAFLELGQNAQALEDLNEAIRLYPDNPVALTNRCWIHAVEGRFELARFDCDEALGLEPEDPIALASRAYVFMQLGDVEAAQVDADQAVVYGDHLWQTHFYRGLAYESAGDLTRAAESYTRAVDLAPDEPRIRQKLAEIGVAEQ